MRLLPSPAGLVTPAQDPVKGFIRVHSIWYSQITTRYLATLVLTGYQLWQAASIQGRLLSWIKQIPGTIDLRKYQCGNQTWRIQALWTYEEWGRFYPHISWRRG